MGSIPGFGSIRYNQDFQQYTGALFEESKILDNEIKQYQLILDRLYQYHEFKIDEKFKSYIRNMFETIRESETYAYSRSKAMRRILPSFLDNENIRVRLDHLKMKPKKYQQFQFLQEDYEMKAHEYQNKLVAEQFKEKNASAQFQQHIKQPETSDNFIMMYLDTLNQLSKEKVSNLDILNTCSVAYVQPEIKSKYALVANILYLIEIYYNFDFNEKLHLTRSNRSEYKHFIDGILQGFRKFYHQDPEDAQFIQHAYQKEYISSRTQQKPAIPDFVKIELFFIYLDQIKSHLDKLDQIQSEYDRLYALTFSNQNKLLVSEESMHRQKQNIAENEPKIKKLG